MSTMSEIEHPTPEGRGYVIGPEARVVVVRRHDGYAVAVVAHEGPFGHDEAETLASGMRRAGSGLLTKSEAARILGIGTKGVDYLRRQGHIRSTRQHNNRVLVDADSVHDYQARRDG